MTKEEALRTLLSPPTPASFDVEIARVFASALVTQSAQAMNALERAHARTHELATTVLDRHLAMSSPQAVALASTLARARAASGSPGNGGQPSSHAPASPPGRLDDEDKEEIVPEEEILRSFNPLAGAGAAFIPSR